jgi:fluoroacetyl-CoA thioesterase
VTLDDLKPGLRHARTLTVRDALAVPAQAQLFDPATEMPPVFATAQMIAFIEWTCLAALTPYIGAHQRTVGTLVDVTHTAATPVGMNVTAEVELVEVDGRRLRFKVACRDEVESIGEGFHERAIIDRSWFRSRLGRKRKAAGFDPSRAPGSG